MKLALAGQATAPDGRAGAAPSAATLTRQLQDSEARFRSLTALSADSYWEHDQAHRYTQLVGGNLAQAGLEPARLIGKTPWECAAVPLGDGGSWARHKAALLKRQPFSDLLFEQLNASGEQ